MAEVPALDIVQLVAEVVLAEDAYSQGMRNALLGYHQIARAATFGEASQGPRHSRSRRSASGQPSRSHARAITITTPAPVASCLKTEPPIEIGLPVTISGTA